MLKEMRAVSARSSNKLMGWCWKQMFYMSCLPCKNEKNTNNFKTSTLWMGGQERTTIGQHAMDGQEMGEALKFYSLGSVHLFPPCSGPWRWWLDGQVEETVEHLKKKHVFQWHHKTPKIPLGRFQLLPEFWDVFFDFFEKKNWPTKHKRSIAIDTMPIIQVKGLVQLQADPTSSANNPGTQVSRNQGRSMFLLKNWCQKTHRYEGTPWKINMKPTNHLLNLERKMIWSKYPWWCSIGIFRGVIMSLIGTSWCLCIFVLSSWVAFEVMHKLNPIASMGLVYLHLHLP